ncbi:MAG: transcription termination factor Rho, partial [Lachnospiraceae bacterium]|nr:transcription termination factor Rho [Lachnospiraceae bacterium]
MREKYESLALANLKELAKARGIKGTSVMKKAQVVEAMLLQDEKDKAAKGENVNAEPVKPTEAASFRNDAKSKETVQPKETAQAKEAPQSKETVQTRETAQSREATPSKEPVRRSEEKNETPNTDKFPAELDSGITANGILEVMPDGYGFIRCENYLPGENDVYVAPSQIRRFNLKTGDIIEGNTRIKTQSEKFSALLYLKKINGVTPEIAAKRCNFEDMTPVFPDERLHLERPGSSIAMRIMDLISPVGK